MTLHDLLDDLARAQPATSPALAERAWADGRRRRTRTWGRAAVAAAAVVALLVVLVPAAPPELPVPAFARPSAAGVDGHPERIGRQWWVRGLPDRPGALAAVLEAEGGPYVVRADGHRWRLPGEQVHTQVPALSDDGTQLGYLQDWRGPYVVHDVVTGRRTTFPEVKGHLGTVERSRFQVHDQTPARFSPDGRRLLLMGVYDEHLLLDVRAGTLRGLDRRAVGRGGVPVGWSAADRLAWLVDRRADEGEPDVVELVTTDLSGQVVARTQLRPSGGSLPSTSQWTGAVSRDGLTLAVQSYDGAFGELGEVRRFSVQGGQELSAPVRVELESGCALTWAGDAVDPLVATLRPADVEGEPAVHAAEVLASATRPFTVVAPQVRGRCLVWARDALSAPERGGGLLGAETAGWTWWWKELLLAGLALAGLAAHGLQRRRAQGARAAARIDCGDPSTDWYG